MTTVPYARSSYPRTNGEQLALRLSRAIERLVTHHHSRRTASSGRSAYRASVADTQRQREAAFLLGLTTA